MILWSYLMIRNWCNGCWPDGQVTEEVSPWKKMWQKTLPPVCIRKFLQGPPSSLGDVAVWSHFRNFAFSPEQTLHFQSGHFYFFPSTQKGREKFSFFIWFIYSRMISQGYLIDLLVSLPFASSIAYLWQISTSNQRLSIKMHVWFQSLKIVPWNKC